MMIRSLEMKRLLNKLYGFDGRDFSVPRGSMEYRAACELEDLEMIKMEMKDDGRSMVRIRRTWNAKAQEQVQDTVVTKSLVNTPTEGSAIGTSTPGESKTPQEEPQITIEDGVQTKMMGKHKMYLNENGEWRFVV